MQELPRFWVVGVELPQSGAKRDPIRCENANATDTTQTSPAPPYHVGASVELYNAVTTKLASPKVKSSPQSVQQQDGFPIPLLSGDGATAPYQVVIAGGIYNAPITGSPTVLPSIGVSGNPLGTYST